jgi:hypothetical protein
MCTDVVAASAGEAEKMIERAETNRDRHRITINVARLNLAIMQTAVIKKGISHGDA